MNSVQIGMDRLYDRVLAWADVLLPRIVVALALLADSAIWTFPLRNHTRNAGRLVSFNVGFAAGADVARARASASAVLLKAIAGHPGVLAAPAPEVFLANLNTGAPLATCRLGRRPNKSASCRGASSRTRERRSRPTNSRRRVRTVPPDADPSRLL